MDKLDQLIAKFKEAKEELEKAASPLHDSVEGFMVGLKAHPKGSEARNQFITDHVNHGPFTDALNSHPQGKQIHDMLHAARNAHNKAQFANRGSAEVKAQNTQLNSVANAGPGGPLKIKVGDTSAGLKLSVDDELDDMLSKAYFSPFKLFGPSKKVAPAAKPEGPAKPTGIDKIKHVSNQKIQPTSIVADDRKRAAAMGAPSNPTDANKPAKLTGMDRIKAESQKPIAPMSSKVKKDENEDEDVEEKAKKKLEEVKKSMNMSNMAGQMKGSGNSTLTHPSDMSRANYIHSQMTGGTYKPTVAPKKLTGMDRIKAAASQPIAKDEFHAPKEGGYGKVSGRLITQPIPKLKPAGAKYNHVGHDGTNNTPNQLEDTHVTKEPTVSLRPGNFTKTINTSSAPTNMAMSAQEKLSLNKSGQWSLGKAEDLHDEKGRCVSCGSKACDGADCKTDHAKVAVKANDSKNKEFSNKIKIAKDEKGC